MGKGTVLQDTKTAKETMGGIAITDATATVTETEMVVVVNVMAHPGDTVTVIGTVNGTGSASVIEIVSEIETGTIETGIASEIETVIGTEREIGTANGIGTASGVRAKLGIRLDLEG